MGINTNRGRYRKESRPNLIRALALALGAFAMAALLPTAEADFIERWNDPLQENNDWKYWAPGSNTGTRPADGQSQDAAWWQTGGVGDGGYISSPDLSAPTPLNAWEPLWNHIWPAYQAPPDPVDPVTLAGQSVAVSVNDLGTGMANWIAQNSSLHLFIGEWDAGSIPGPEDDRYVFYKHRSEIAIGGDWWLQTQFDVGTDNEWDVIEHNYGPTDQDAFDNRPPEELYLNPQQWGFAFSSVGVVPLPSGARLGFDSLIIPEPSPMVHVVLAGAIMLIARRRPWTRRFDPRLPVGTVIVSRQPPDPSRETPEGGAPAQRTRSIVERTFAMSRPFMTIVTMTCILLFAPRVHADFMIDSFFDVITDVTSGPPYPSDPPILIAVYDAAEVTNGQPVVDESLSFDLVDTPQLPARITASDSGGPQGTAGIDSFFEVFYEVAAPQFPASSSLALHLQVEPPATINAVRELVATPEITFGDSFFDVFFDITVTDVDPRADRHRQHLQGVVGSGLRLTNVGLASTGPGAAGESFFDVFVEIDLPGLLQIDPATEPIMTMQLNGQLIPEPATASFVLLATAMIGHGRGRRRLIGRIQSRSPGTGA